jgi:hypothetical protein
VHFTVGGFVMGEHASEWVDSAPSLFLTLAVTAGSQAAQIRYRCSSP